MPLSKTSLTAHLIEVLPHRRREHLAERRVELGRLDDHGVAWTSLFSLRITPELGNLPLAPGRAGRRSTAGSSTRRGRARRREPPGLRK